MKELRDCIHLIPKAKEVWVVTTLAYGEKPKVRAFQSYEQAHSVYVDWLQKRKHIIDEAHRNGHNCSYEYLVNETTHASIITPTYAGKIRITLVEVESEVQDDGKETARTDRFRESIEPGIYPGYPFS